MKKYYCRLIKDSEYLTPPYGGEIYILSEVLDEYPHPVDGKYINNLNNICEDFII